MDQQRLRRRAVLFLLAGVLSGCDFITGNSPEPSTIVISPSAITFDAIGATESTTVEVRDQNNQVLPNAVVTWSSSDPMIATVSATGAVTSVGNGLVMITAVAGTASGSASVSVSQLAAVLEKLSGEGQLGDAGEPLSEPLVVRARDRLGNPAAAVPVEFEIVEGGGSVTPSQSQTDSEGRASATWTLGTLAGQEESVRSFLSFRVGEGVNFEATSVAGVPAGILIVSGEGQAAPRLSTLSDLLVVRVEDRFQNPVEGVPVEFAVIAGQGSVQPSTTTTDVGGLASAEWTLGEPLGDQMVSVALESLQSTILSATATAVPVQVEILGGDGQVGIAGEQLPGPPSVRVLAQGGAPVASLDVKFSVSGGGGLLGVPQGNELSSSLTVRTDQNGVATVGGWILGTVPGSYEVRVEVPGLAPVILTATAETGPPAILTKVSGDGQTGVAGALLGGPLVVQVTDIHGNPVAGTTVTFEPALGSGTVHPAETTTNPDGTASTQWILGSFQGPQSVTASIEAGASAVLNATATDENGIGGLAIELLFIDQPTIVLRQAFDDAVDRWRELIPGKFEPVPLQLAAGACGANSPAIDGVVDDLLVFVRLQSIDGVAGTLGLAGVCLVRGSTGLPLAARLTLDSDDVGRLETGGRLVDLILHELAHALGFGTLWSPKGFLENPSLANGIGADTHFTGPSAVTAFDAVGGDAYTGGQKVPVENEEGGVGSRDSHWRVSVLVNELMTGFLTRGANPLSRVTVASLQDLGYEVDEQEADVYQLNLAPTPPAVQGEPLPLGDDVYRGTIYVVDDEGRILGVLEK